LADGEALWVGLVGRPCGSAFRPTPFGWIGTDPVGLKPDPQECHAARRAEARPTVRRPVGL